MLHLANDRNDYRNLVAFYYGNLTHPSVDPPRIGFLSMVQGNASAELTAAVSSAQAHGGNFESTSQAASTATQVAQSLVVKENVASSTSYPITETATITVAPASEIVYPTSTTSARSDFAIVASATATRNLATTTTTVASGAGRLRGSVLMVVGGVLWMMDYAL